MKWGSQRQAPVSALCRLCVLGHTLLSWDLTVTSALISSPSYFPWSSFLLHVLIRFLHSSSASFPFSFPWCPSFFDVLCVFHLFVLILYFLVYMCTCPHTRMVRSWWWLSSSVVLNLSFVDYKFKWSRWTHAPSMFLFPSLRPRNHRNAHPCSVVHTWVLRIELRSSCLGGNVSSFFSMCLVLEDWFPTDFPGM